MTDAPGRLASLLSDRYRVERELGQGGMATVYLAHDVRHDRKVALKVLRPELAAILGGERFLKEIRTTANLQHPHILPLHDSGEADGTVFYVMPYIEGETLRDRLEREKQLPVDDAIRIAREVSDALDYAHGHGVVHRDIKPENILLQGGHALVADFGIALAASKSEGSARMTETGMSLGTPHYMAPEQAMGERDITAKADIYALGCVLYEMLAGEPPFTGPTAQAIVARVMTERPRPLSSQRHTVPEHIEAAIMTALEKLPADRFATAAQFAAALEIGEPAYPRTGGRRLQYARTPSRRYLPWLVAALAAAAALAGWLRPRTGPSAEPSRLAILSPGLGGSGAPMLHRQLAFTPDGRQLVFVAIGTDGYSKLWRQPLDAAEPLAIAGSFNSIASPVVSPDGRWLVGTNAQTGQVVRLPLEGGTAVALPQVATTLFAAFASDGALWASLPGFTGLLRLGDRDSVRPVLADRVTSERVLQVLPGDRLAIVSARQAGAATGLVHLLDLESGESTPLLPAPVVEARYTAGLLVYVQGDGSMMAAPLDLGSRRVTGAAISIASGVSLTGTGVAQLAVAANGSVAYIPEEPRSLVVVDRSGSVRDLTPERRNFHAPVFAPDGRRLSTDFTSADGRDVWILTLGEGTLSRATFVRDGHDATWAPDGRLLTFTSARSGSLGIYRARPGSAEPAESLLAGNGLAWTGHWLNDGSGLVTAAANLRDSSLMDIGVVRNAGRGPIEPLVSTRFIDNYPALSPDGRWLAFVSDQSGQPQVYLRSLARGDDQIQVSRDGGTEPVWSRDGRELFYRGLSGGQTFMMAAAIRTSGALAVTGRQTLFAAAEFVQTQPHSNYDVTPDGRGFVMVRRSPSTRIMVIQNLPALIDRMRGAAGSSR